jgi:anti-sigma B factor antagonist
MKNLSPLSLVERLRRPAQLEILQRETEGITILDLKGRLTLGCAEVLLRERLLSLLEAGTQNVILNFHLNTIDTTGIGTLVFCAMKFREAGGKLVLVNLTSAHAQLSAILKLNTVFETYREERDAVNSFFPERAIVRYDILQFVETCNGTMRTKRAIPSTWGISVVSLSLQYA